MNSPSHEVKDKSRTEIQILACSTTIRCGQHNRELTVAQAQDPQARNLDVQEWCPGIWVRRIAQDSRRLLARSPCREQG